MAAFIVITVALVVAAKLESGRLGFSWPVAGWTALLVYAICFIFVLLPVGVYSSSRWRREHALKLNSRSPIFSVYLNTQLVSVLARQPGPRVGPYAESVSLGFDKTGITFWGDRGLRSPVGYIDFESVQTVTFETGSDGFARPVIKLADSELALFAATGWMGLTNRASRRLFDTLTDAVAARRKTT